MSQMCRLLAPALLAVMVVAAEAATASEDLPLPQPTTKAASGAATSNVPDRPLSMARSDDRGCCLLRTARPIKSGNRCSDNSRRDACARAASAAGLSTSDWDFYKDTKCEDVSACPD